MSASEQLGKLWDFVRGIAVKDAEHQTYVVLPDPSAAIEKVEPNRHYFQLAVADMFLSQRRAWFTEWYPAVTAQVQLRFAGQDKTPLCRVASPPKGKLGEGIFLNYPLTDRLPYAGGDVSVQADLIAMKGDNAFELAFQLLERFSKLIAAPLASSLAVAETVASGLNILLEGSAEKTRLGFHQRFNSTGGAGFRPGYHAVILEPEQTFTKGGFAQLTDAFHVENGRLRIRAAPGAPPQPLVGYDYVLFRLEASETREDWNFPEIETHLARARQALSDAAAAADDDEKQLHKKLAEKYRNAAFTAIKTSPDLVKSDTTRVAEAVQAELDDLAQRYAQGIGLAKAVGRRSLSDIVLARAVSPAVAWQRLALQEE